ncbi:hypothetical protein [Bacillus amyloliquefaciens]|uniref:hypothetical protein n=1 Tax=Bacillus amyloliquefaciens TaxID=1390 RepID=UPI000E287FC0|nr:hypothetical protein [Bacillus amyloliquefaciens]RDY83147.1 hypothetical protein C3733_20015 [Bacillus amyloliquefaciens]
MKTKGQNGLEQYPALSKVIDESCRRETERLMVIGAYSLVFLLPLFLISQAFTSFLIGHLS